MIKISTIGGMSFEGEVFAIDPVTKSIVLINSVAEGTYVIVNPAQISEMTGDFQSMKTPDISKLGISLSSLEKKEDTAFKLAETRIAALNASVDSDIQVLFDRLSFIYSCKWDGSSIVVLDEYIIEAPYQSVRVIDGKEGSGLERLKKILEGERRKLNL